MCPSFVSTDFLLTGETSIAARSSLRFKRVFVFSTFILPLLKYVPIKFEFVRRTLFPSVPKMTLAEEGASDLLCSCCRSVLHCLVFDFVSKNTYLLVS